jgi:predicted nucleic acid-binding protein
VGRALGAGELERFQSESAFFTVVEVDLRVAEDAAGLAISGGLRSLQAIHLAAALSLPSEALAFATWDRRLHRAAREGGLTLLPESLA